MKVRQLLLLIILGCLAGLLEATTVTFLPFPFSYLRVTIPILISFIILQRPESAYVFAVSAGGMLDLFAVGTISFAFARLLVIALLVALVAETVLTNHSLYAAVALTLFARLLDWAWLACIQAVVRIGGSAAHLVPGWREAVWMLFFDGVIITAAFLVNHVVFKRFVAFRLARR